ncbi:thymidine kinase [Acidipropionibacterium timonense]|uniref:thymidine kinase n=1 Tax=Acidipropionibacterium timonense TaxID=2161818 RepID=UPI00102F7584|nr:thymidine kinase [Acidipropionibacterium timonense]
MAELVFYTGPMDSGKSTLALQIDWTQSAHDRQGVRYTTLDRSGHPRITSRIGLSAEAVEVAGVDLYKDVVARLTRGGRIDYLICDEAQFYAPEQIDQLARVVDELGIDVFCFGILADFRTELFPGSKRLVELCDRLDRPPATPLCWCGRPATHNARVVDGVMVTEGDQVVVGDTVGAQVHYEVLCRRHHWHRVTVEQSRATLSEQTLPFEE